MPLLSKRGSSSSKGFGALITYGSSEWLWIYRLNPAPATTSFPYAPPTIFYDSSTRNTWISFYTPLSYNTAFLGNHKTLKISSSNQLSEPSGISSYFNTANPTYRYKLDGLGNTSMYSVGSGLQLITATYYTRPGLIQMGSTGVSGTTWFPAYTDATYMTPYTWASSLAFISGTPTVFYSAQYAVGTPTKDIFGSINTSSSVGFSKYLLTSASATVYVNSIKYNPVDSFVYIHGYNSTGQGFLAKYSTAGVLQWQRQFTTPANSSSGSIAFSGTDIYIAVSSSANVNMIKYSNAGTISTGRAITTSSGFFVNDMIILPNGNFLLIDSSGNYMVLNNNFIPVISKSFVFASANNYALSNYVQIDDDYNIYISGYTVVGSAAPYDTNQFIIKMPIYSKKTQTYTIGATTLTSSLLSPTSSALTPADAAGTHIETSVAVSGTSVGWTTVGDNPSTTITIQ